MEQINFYLGDRIFYLKHLVGRFFILQFQVDSSMDLKSIDQLFLSLTFDLTLFWIYLDSH